MRYWKFWLWPQRYRHWCENEWHIQWIYTYHALERVRVL